MRGVFARLVDKYKAQAGPMDAKHPNKMVAKKPKKSTVLERLDKRLKGGEDASEIMEQDKTAVGVPLSFFVDLSSADLFLLSHVWVSPCSST